MCPDRLPELGERSSEFRPDVNSLTTHSGSAGDPVLVRSETTLTAA